MLLILISYQISLFYTLLSGLSVRKWIFIHIFSAATSYLFRRAVRERRVVRHVHRAAGEAEGKADGSPLPRGRGAVERAGEVQRAGVLAHGDRAAGRRAVPPYSRIHS